jgi:hypothetical protein
MHCLRRRPTQAGDQGPAVSSASTNALQPPLFFDAAVHTKNIPTKNRRRGIKEGESQPSTRNVGIGGLRPTPLRVVWLRQEHHKPLEIQTQSSFGRIRPASAEANAKKKLFDQQVLGLQRRRRQREEKRMMRKGRSPLQSL